MSFLRREMLIHIHRLCQFLPLPYYFLGPNADTIALFGEEESNARLWQEEGAAQDHAAIATRRWGTDKILDRV